MNINIQIDIQLKLLKTKEKQLNDVSQKHEMWFEISDKNNEKLFICYDLDTKYEYQRKLSTFTLIFKITDSKLIFKKIIVQYDFVLGGDALRVTHLPGQTKCTNVQLRILGLAKGLHL